MTVASPSAVTSPARASFRAIGTEHVLLATDRSALDAALALAQDHLAALDRAASRFRSDSEVSALAAACRTGAVTTTVSPLLAAYLAAGIRTAEFTDGLVDFTVGTAVVAAGYDADIDIVRTRTPGAADPARVPDSLAGRASLVPGWRQVDLEGTRLRLPVACLIDLGASAKAHAADVIAAALHRSLPGGFLVNLGGDIAVSGPAPSDGWRVGLEDADGALLQTVATTGAAVTTSSTRHRQWQLDGRTAHHIIDPRTGESARTPWAQVTCVADTALLANAASTAAIILGAAAPAWLAAHGIPARLDALDGTVTTTAGWPAPEPSRKVSS